MDDIIDYELRNPLHVSFSQVSTWLRCPESFRLRYVAGAAPSHQSANLVFGSAIHGALAFHHECLRRDGKPAVLDEVLHDFADRWQAAQESSLRIQWDDEDSPQKLFDLGRELLTLYLETVQVGAVLAVEKQFSLPIYDSRGARLEETLVGFVDVIEQDADGSVWITELKTAARRFDEFRLLYDHQLSLYAAAREVLGIPNAGLRFRVLLKQKKPAVVTYDVPRQALQVAESLHVVRQVLRAVDAGIFFPVRSYQCTSCAFRARCGE
jgi:hypothetical protein